MKKIKPKKWFVLFRFLILFISILLINPTNNNKQNYLICDNNKNKMVETNIIEDNYESLETARLYKSKDKFIGNLTAYVGNCASCSGILACEPRTNVLEKGIYFDDKEYGKIRIVATSTNIACGTILKFTSSKLGEEPIIAIAMDHGVRGNNVDLLVDDVDYAIKNVGRIRKQQFDILRYGWN